MNQYLSFAIQTGLEAGQKLFQNFPLAETDTRGTPKEVKSMFDEIADKHIKKAIEEIFPEHSYLTEETGLVKKDPDFLWIIDPLDGTGNFMNANPFFAVSIALWIKGEPVVAAIEAPALFERYVAVKGYGAKIVNLKNREERDANVSTQGGLKSSYIVSCEGGVPKKRRQKIQAVYDQLILDVKDLRKLGSAALELAWVGTGRADAYITQEISIWDIAAGVLFVEEAGGKILGFDGKKLPYSEMLKAKHIDLITTNGKLKIPKLKIPN